ncbi:hypothetical protein B0H13DRAFT_1850902 [Mycena leptocephala]|nr:hypothetical protein B0H13DRAFT_1850902 [Mycena leptocephala]
MSVSTQLLKISEVFGRPRRAPCSGAIGALRIVPGNGYGTYPPCAMGKGCGAYCACGWVQTKGPNVTELMRMLDADAARSIGTCYLPEMRRQTFDERDDGNLCSPQNMEGKVGKPTVGSCQASKGHPIDREHRWGGEREVVGRIM